MITLPDHPAPNAATPTPADYGFIQRPSTGAAATRIDRPGTRWQVEFSFPPMKADVARVFVSRLAQAKSDGLRIEFPLLVPQGAPGSPTVDGSGAVGTALPVKGLTPYYTVKEGYWLTAIDGDGVHYLYVNRATVSADASGEATLTVWPPHRAPLADDDVILLAKPMVEGLVTSDVGWTLTPSRLVTLGFVLEEAS